MTDRVCKECKQTLPETKFKAGVTKAGKPFRVNKCYACVYKKDQAKQRVYVRNYYLAHKAECHARSAAWRKAHLEQYNLSRRKRRLRLALKSLRGNHGA